MFLIIVFVVCIVALLINAFIQKNYKIPLKERFNGKSAFWLIVAIGAIIFAISSGDATALITLGSISAMMLIIIFLY